ncbi:THUMP domain-containing class I SAM-dependent RNA methyltransferase [Peptoniphilaceae bacterium SGI.131]
MQDKIYEIIATAAFGLEGLVKRECQNLGFENVHTSNGKVEFTGSFRDIVRANLWLRSADRVLIKLLEFKAVSFEELFENLKVFDWWNYLSENGKYIVNARSLKSKLYSLRDIQAISKKAIVSALSKHYDKDWFFEDGEDYRIEISILKDFVTVGLDTSGAALHKRGYRLKQNQAPMKETLAAALVQLSKWDGTRPLVDFCCGSGTILIEAAMLAKNIAPGISRDFAFFKYPFFDKEVFRKEKKYCYEVMKKEKLDITGFDIDPKAVEIARDNALNMGLEDDINFVVKDMQRVGLKDNFGVVISNPPYGQRLGDEKSLRLIYDSLKEKFKSLFTWSYYIITADKDFEREVGKQADQKRKLYNGRIEVDYYQFIGPNPKDLF